mgnify:CR=1 FL=1
MPSERNPSSTHHTLFAAETPGPTQKQVIHVGDAANSKTLLDPIHTYREQPDKLE